MKKAGSFKSLLKILFGTAGGQVVLLCSLPVFSRIYGPSQFADYAIVLSITNILGVVMALRLENAIFHYSGARKKIAFTLAICVAFFAALAIMVLLVAIGSVVRFNGEVMLVSVVSALGFSLYNTFCVFLNAASGYGEIAILKVSRPLLEVVFALLLSLFDASYFYAIPLSYVFVVVSFLMFFPLYKNLVLSRKALRAMFLKSRGSVFYDTPASLCVAASNYAPFLILGLAFDKAVLGLYALAFRVVIGPINTLLQSISYISRQELSAANFSGGLYEKFCVWRRKLVILGAALLGGILLASYFKLFTFVFGDVWGGVEGVVLALSPIVFAKVVSTPLSFVFIVRKKLGLNLLLQLLGIVVTSSTLLFFVLNGYGVVFTILAYSISYAGFYLLYYRFSQGVAR